VTIRSIARPRLGVAAVALCLVVAACGGDDGASPSDGGRDEAGPGAAAAGEFPATVEHRFGTTEVAEPPERIVTLGFSDQDAVLAFGVAPVAVTDWYGDYEYATWPWAQDELGDAEPTVLNQGEFTGEPTVDYEELAALRPDLIIALYTGMDEATYGLLSEVAPTVAPSGDHPDFGMPWQETTRMVGAALGQPERAEELIEDVEARFAEAAEAHPEFAGVEMVVAEQFEPGFTFARSATDPRTTFMTSLGFVLPEDLAELAGDDDGAPISDEQMELLDRDLLVWNVGHDDTLREQIESKPLYPNLEVVQAGRSVFIEDPLAAGALTWSTVLSLPYALEHVVPLLAEPLAG
jgi:iron complex transport system substrate-binding protein